MHNTLNLCRCLILSLVVLLAPVSAWAGGLSDRFSDNKQIQNAIDTLEGSIESFKTKGEATRGASGPMLQLVQSSDTLICSFWVIAFRQELQRLIVSDFLDPPVELIQAAQDLLSRVERACQHVLQPDTETSMTPPTTGEATTPPSTTPGTSGQPFRPRPGWTITDEICARRCSAESVAVQRTDWRRYDAETAETNARDHLVRAERELAAERENLTRAEARLESARANLARREDFNRRLPPSADGRSNTDLDLAEARASTASATKELPVVRNRVASKVAAVASARRALDRATADRVRAEQEAAAARTALDRCLRDCQRQAKGTEDKATLLSDKTGNKTKDIPDKDRRAVLKDGDPAVKDGAGVEPPKGAQEKTGGGITEGTSVCQQCWVISNQLAYAEDMLVKSRARLDELTARRLSYTDSAMRSQVSPSDIRELKELGQEVEEIEPRISRYVDEVQRLRSALEQCLEACRGGGIEVKVEVVVPGGGNNPFFPLNPLGGDQVTAPTCANNGHNCSAVPCTTPQPSGETQTQVCPSGQSGSIIQSRHYVCAIGSWRPVDWTTTSNTCTAAPSPGCTTPQPDSETRQQACLPGQTAGTIIQTRGYSCVDNSYSKTWMPGAWQIVSNSCCDLSARPQPDGQNIACPTGQTGTITQQRAYVCSNGSWVPGTNWVEVARTCTTPQTGCSTNFSGGNYVCGGSCGIGSAVLTVTSGSSTMKADPLGSNNNVLIDCSGATASPLSTNLIILGQPGHNCTFSGLSLSAFEIACRNNSGGSCSSSCSR